MINTMIFTPTFGTITSGQVIIPGGTRAFDINVVSGYAYINGVLVNQGVNFKVGFGDSKLIMSPEASFAVGTTGAGATRVTYLYVK